jgi:uncharacterized membrane protein YoaK (UPF0700 family)
MAEVHTSTAISRAGSPTLGRRPAGTIGPVSDGVSRAVSTDQRNRLVVLLALVSGATDATGFLALGGAFTSVMTGNMVLMGVAVGSADASAVGLILSAFGGYVAGAALGSRVAGTPQPEDPTWPAAVSRALAIELALFAVFGAAWWLLGSDPSTAWGAPLLALTAMALGLQSSAILRFGVPGLSTTYLTGTLTTVVVRLVNRQPLHTVRHSAVILVALVAGAAAGSALVTQLPAAAPALQLVLLGGVLAATWAPSRERVVA